MVLIKDEPDSGSEACVTALDDEAEDGNMKFEEADIKFEEVDIKIEEPVIVNEENPEAITFTPINTESEVSVWGLCVRQKQFMLPRTFYCHKKITSENTS
jgi:hypothetical protein